MTRSIFFCVSSLFDVGVPTEHATYGGDIAYGETRVASLVGDSITNRNAS